MFVQDRSASDAGGPLRLMTSASDLTAASMCEFAFLRRVDAKLGRDVVVPPDDDPMLRRAADLGDAHEERTLAAYRDRFAAATPGRGVVEIPRPESMAGAALAEVASETQQALAGRAEVVFQATFYVAPQPVAGWAAEQLEVGFVGFADFLRLRGDAYEVQDTKLARRAKVTALMQLAAYAEQLERIGIPVTPEAVLILGDGAQSRHKLSDIAPVFRARRARLHRMLTERALAVGSDGRRESANPVAWGGPDVVACGRCEVCEPEIARSRDPLLIAGIRRSQRDLIVAAGLTTIDAVAALDGAAAQPTTGVAADVLARIAAQAAVQLESEAGGRPAVRVVDPTAFAALPLPNPGDLFFDFEGDPMFREPGDAARTRWGIDYLFGMVDVGERFTALWAHDLAAERQALIDFLALVAERRARFPAMRIYHYAAYERTHLLSIAARHGVGEAAVDRLLSEHVLVDLYPIVRRALRVGSRSYSIKKLEPLYMGDELRDETGVTSGAQSVTEYAEASAQLSSPDLALRAAGAARLAAIADYNRYDCVSTLRLRDWLLSLASAAGVVPHAVPESPEEATPPLELSSVAAELAAHQAAATDQADRTAIALAASAIDYHQREQKSFWWAHFARLVDPIDDWAETRDVMVVAADESRVLEAWHRPPRARSDRRRMLLRGALAPGSRLRPGSDVYALYEHPAPFPTFGSAPGARGAKRVKVVESLEDGAVIIDESLGADGSPYDVLPTAITPGPPPPAGAQKSAIEEWGAALVATYDAGETPRDPVMDLLRRATPRLRGDALPANASDDTIEAVTASLLRLEHSYLAVQGPPGTGKTYLAARVIRALVEQHGWRVGVVAQSHKVVENVLSGVVGAGLDPEHVGKVPQGGGLDPAGPQPDYTVLGRNGLAAFLRDHGNAGRGCVVGGTAWDFSNASRVGRRELDLLVVDEAGQFSLAPTIAAAVSADRLLLLGDPQQLPQVSQGSHPEPVDTSALGWLLGEHETMPPELGFFLAQTRRMRPELTKVVSHLSYDDRLTAHPTAAERVVSGAGPAGLVWHPVSHRGNSTYSDEEARAVVEIATQVLQGKLSEAAGESRALTQSDLIVVAAYNAQVECVVTALAAAGLGDVPVGTVDKFQGQEAAIAIVTLAASSADDVARGLDFLLMRNRLNVALSRAQWAAHLVSSDRLGDGLPATAEGLAALSGYLGVLEAAAETVR